MVKKNVTLECIVCGKKESFEASSPAAPMLTACEKAHETKGWSYSIGFFSMLTGDHQTRCANCSKHKKGDD